MNHHQSRRHQAQRTVTEPAGGEAPAPIQGPPAFLPSSDAVARRAYLRYVAEGSKPGHDVRHWLAAEAELVAEQSGA